MIVNDHVAISNQFLRKTMQNLYPVATLLLDPGDGESYKLLARSVRSENEGKGFDDARLALDSMAAMVGMQDVFSLKGLEVFRVLDVVQVPSQRDLTASHAGPHTPAIDARTEW